MKKLFLLINLFLLLGTQVVGAQSIYPDKPIRMVIAFPPGGPTDLVARVLAQKVSEQIGQQVVVDNKPGANGNIAAEVVSKSPADGYTIFYNTSAIALSPALYKKLAYDVSKDFSPVLLSAVIPLVLVVHPSLPVKNLKEFVAYVKAHPDKLSYGSAGNGNITHLGAFQILQSQGLKATHVPYRGSSPALTDLAAGQTQFMTDTINSALPFIKDGRMRAIAVTSLERSKVLPDVPTINESLVKGFEVGAWQGVLVPTKTPPEVVKFLNAQFNKALNSSDVRARLSIQGTMPLGSTSEQYGAYIQSEIKRWSVLVNQTGASLE